MRLSEAISLILIRKWSFPYNLAVKRYIHSVYNMFLEFPDLMFVFDNSIFAEINFFLLICYPSYDEFVLIIRMVQFKLTKRLSMSYDSSICNPSETFSKM